MKKIIAWLVIVIGILLVLAEIPGLAPALKMGIWAKWVVAIIVLAIGIIGLLEKKEEAVA